MRDHTHCTRVCKLKMARQLQLSFTRQLPTSTTCSLSLEDPDVPLSLEQEPEPRISGAQGTTDVENEAVFQTTFPLISCILARIVVLPASS